MDVPSAIFENEMNGKNVFRKNGNGGMAHRERTYSEFIASVTSALPNKVLESSSTFRRVALAAEES